MGAGGAVVGSGPDDWHAVSRKVVATTSDVTTEALKRKFTIETLHLGGAHAKEAGACRN
jgi:hypothetical protein